MSISIGEATIRLLARYGIDTVFGIPGVHTLEFCRGLGQGSAVRHIQCRSEMGAGLAADGYARSSGQPGVVLTISGPGVTNAATPLGVSWNDSVPVLLISADTSRASQSKGWGVLHEVSDLCAVTAPLTRFSARAMQAGDLPVLMARAFAGFSSGRPRPAHISIPVDLLEEMTDEEWAPQPPTPRAVPSAGVLEQAAGAFANARRPLIVAGGGSLGAADELRQLAEARNAPVITTSAGKGVLPETHPLSLGNSLSKPEIQRLLAQADLLLAIGTELSETDSFTERLELPQCLIRIDIDPDRMSDFYPASHPVPGDAAAALRALAQRVGPDPSEWPGDLVTRIRGQISAELSGSEPRHKRLLDTLRQVLPANAIVFGDACQLAYSGAYLFPTEAPRLWHDAGGYCTLGGALPGAIGARLAQPDRSVVALCGDGGFMFTCAELMTAAEQRLPLPVILWDNQGYKQIRDDMLARNVPRVGVDGLAPDFTALAKAMRCASVRPNSLDEFGQSVQTALAATGPTLIHVDERETWLD